MELLFVVMFAVIPISEQFRSQIKLVFPDGTMTSIAWQLLSAPERALRLHLSAAGDGGTSYINQPRF